MTTATIDGIKTIPPVPSPGDRYLSVNLASVSLASVLEVASTLGFKPELVQIPYRFGKTEIHALLWHGSLAETPSDLDDKILALAEQLDDEAIRHVYNQRSAA